MRHIIFLLLCWTRWSKTLSNRMVITEVGFTGHVSFLDKDVQRLKKIKSLNRFERWLLKPIINSERDWRRQAFREACIEVLGCEEEK